MGSAASTRGMGPRLEERQSSAGHGHPVARGAVLQEEWMKGAERAVRLHRVGRAQVPRAPVEGGATDGEGQGRRTTSLYPSCRPRSRTPQQGNRGAVDRVVPKDAVLQPLHQRRRYIRADKAHEARRRTPTRFNAASPNVAQTYSTRASLKRALRGRLIAEKGGPQRDWQAGWKGAHARRDDGEQALASKRAQGRRARARSARSRNRAAGGRSASSSEGAH